MQNILSHSAIMSSLLAVFLVIACGFALKATGIIAAEAWAGFERVTYLVLFPAVIIQTLGFARPGNAPFIAVAATLVGAILVVSAALVLLRPLLFRWGVSGPAFTSLFQGSVRWNTFVALALAGSLHGSAGVALMAVAIAAMVPLLNILSVSILARHGSSRRIGAIPVLKAILSNPFVWSSMIGLALNPIAMAAPKIMVSSLDIVSRASLACGLLVVGSGLELGRLARPGLACLLATAIKLLVMPLLAFLMARQLGISGQSLEILLIAASVPTATASYILARQMGGDAPLMAEIITIQTLAALLTLPLALLLLA
jgi:malonate transporter and related proteins